MKKYIIQKEIRAKNLKDALKREKHAEIIFIDKIEKEEEKEYKKKELGFIK